MDGEDLMDCWSVSWGHFRKRRDASWGAADSLLCIKRKMHHIKDTKIKQAVLDQSYEIVFFYHSHQMFRRNNARQNIGLTQEMRQEQ